MIGYYLEEIGKLTLSILYATSMYETHLYTCLSNGKQKAHLYFYFFVILYKKNAKISIIYITLLAFYHFKHISREVLDPFIHMKANFVAIGEHEKIKAYMAEKWPGK